MTTRPHNAGFFIPLLRRSRTRPQHFRQHINPTATYIKDRAHGAALAQRYTDKINLSQTKTALHRTRLRFLDLEIFSVLFFYKPDRQTAPPLAACRKTQTEKIEKNFSTFQFYGSVEDLSEFLTNR
ncbi:TPA: hypothetical protein ACNAIP_004531 [Citrobacter amalonaticus]